MGTKTDTENIPMRWYAVHVYSESEKKVMEMLREQILEEGLQAYFGDILVPEEKVIELREGKKYEKQRKFFPGYLLLEMHLDDDTWSLVNQVNKVVGFIGGNKPTVVPIAEVDRIRNNMESSNIKPTHVVSYEPGEMVKVTEGPFKEFNAVVEDVDLEKNKARVAVVIFGRSTPVTLEFTQIQKV